MNVSFLRITCIASCVLFCFGMSNESNNSISNDTQYDDIMFEWSRTWAEVMHLVKQKHYKVVNLEKAMIKAIDAFLNFLDPHSNLLDPKTYKSISDSISGEFAGIGIIIDNTRKTKDKFLTIVETITNGPSDHIGIKQYDKIIEIEGKSLEGMTTEEATSQLKGKKGTKVQIKIMREGSPELLSFTIERDIIKDQSALSFYIKHHSIYYISLSMFTQNAAQQMEQLLTKTKNTACTGIIIDLRNNSGGLLHSAIDIAGLFLDPKSLVVTTKDKMDTELEQYKTDRTAIAHRAAPLFILINNYTASAAEILAGCLKIHAQKGTQKEPLMVFLVGSPTFGKGSVQEIIPISNNNALKLTTSLYFLPYNIPVQAVGIEPDFKVERCLPPTEQMTWFTESYGHENKLENHISLTPTQPKEKKKKNETLMRWQERIAHMLQTDNQLQEAIRLITLLHSASKNNKELTTNYQQAYNYLKSTFVEHNNLEFEEIKA